MKKTIIYVCLTLLFSVGCGTKKRRVYPVDGFAVAGTVLYSKKTPTVSSNRFITTIREDAFVDGALVQVLDTSDNNKIIADGVTGKDGSFIIGLPPESEGRPLLVRVLTVSGLEKFPMMVLNQAAEPHTYHQDSEIFVSTTNDMLVTIDDNDLSGAFNVFSQIMRGYRFVTTYGGEANTNFPELEVFWENGQVGIDCTCFFKRFLTPATINLREDENDDSVILHEFGHYLQIMFSHDTSPGGDHYLSCDQNDDPRLTWSEGWSTGFSLIVRRSQYYIDTDNQNFFIEHETPCHIGQGPVSETVIAAMYLDLYDGSANDMSDQDGDTISITFLQIWKAMKRVPLGLKLTVYDYYLALLAGGAITKKQWENNFSALGLTESNMLFHSNPQNNPEVSPHAPPRANPEFYAHVIADH